MTVAVRPSLYVCVIIAHQHHFRLDSLFLDTVDSSVLLGLEDVAPKLT